MPFRQCHRHTGFPKNNQHLMGCNQCPNETLDMILSMTGMYLPLADITIPIRLQRIAHHPSPTDLHNANRIISHLTILPAALKILLLTRASALRRPLVIQIIQMPLWVRVHLCKRSRNIGRCLDLAWLMNSISVSMAEMVVVLVVVDMDRMFQGNSAGRAWPLGDSDDL